MSLDKSKPASDVIEESLYDNLNALLTLLRQITNSAVMQLSIDPNNRLKITLDALPSGTNVLGAIATGGVFPVNQREEIIQRSNLEFSQCQRTHFTF